jgi:hypothetical protein
MMTYELIDGSEYNCQVTMFPSGEFDIVDIYDPYKPYGFRYLEYSEDGLFKELTWDSVEEAETPFTEEDMRELAKMMSNMEMEIGEPVIFKLRSDGLFKGEEDGNIYNMKNKL